MEQQTNNKFTEIEQTFSKRRSYWMEWISDMNKCLKDMDSLVTLQSNVYVKRQEALDNYHTLAATLAKWTKSYKEHYAAMYKDIRMMKTSQGATTYMFPTESAIKDQIEAKLSDEKYLVDIMCSHLEYLDGTIKSIDGIIYAIQNRIKIEEIKIGK